MVAFAISICGRKHVSFLRVNLNEFRGHRKAWLAVHVAVVCQRKQATREILIYLKRKKLCVFSLQIFNLKERIQASG